MISDSKENLVIPVADHIELRLLTQDQGDDEYKLLMDDYDFLSQWIFWLDEKFDRQSLRSDMADNLRNFHECRSIVMGVYTHGKLAGAVDVRDIVQGESAEVGYFIASKFGNKGLAALCTQALIDYVHEKHDVPYLYLHTLTNNAASSRVAEKMGFVYERTIRNKEYDVDEKRYGLTLPPKP